MRVLLAVDDDPALEDVLGSLRWCVRLGPADQVVVLHGTRYPWMRRAADTDEACQAWVTDEDAASEALLAGARERLARWGISAETVRAPGHPGEEILRTARERGADLVVVGALGWQHRGFLVGSVTQKVAQLAETDVLVVRRGAPLGDDPMRAVLAVDGSAESLAAVRAFAGKLHSGSAEVTVVHVLDLPPVSAWDAVRSGRPVEAERLPATLRAQVDAALQPALEVLRSHGVAARVEVWRGKPADEILSAADRHRAHLVAIGSRGLSGIRGLVQGSVARRVMTHGITSVLLARAAS